MDDDSNTMTVLAQPSLPGTSSCRHQGGQALRAADEQYAAVMAKAEVALASGPAFNVEDGLDRFTRWMADIPSADQPIAEPGTWPAEPDLAIADVSQLRGGPLVMRVRLGRYLRRLRETQGTRASHAAEAILGSASRIYAIELGRWTPVSVGDATALLAAYGVTDQQVRDQVTYLAAQCAARTWWHTFAEIIPDWFEPYMELEEAAAGISAYAVNQIPELLQTRDYARAMLMAWDPVLHADQAELRLKLLEARQSALSGSHPVRYHAVIDESALRSIPGPEVALGQLRHLVSAATRPNISIEVVPLTSMPVYGGSFSILRPADPDLPVVACTPGIGTINYLQDEWHVSRYEGAFARVSATASPGSTSTALHAALSYLTETAAGWT